MKPSKILFPDEVHQRVLSYKEATGVSFQRFVNDAVLEKLERVEIEQYLKDLPYLKNDNDAIIP